MAMHQIKSHTIGCLLHQIFGEFIPGRLNYAVRAFFFYMKILVFGAGAVGGYFGGKLHKSGSDVTFLVRGLRRKQLATTGLKIFSPHGDFDVDVRCRTIEDKAENFDLVLFSCKAYHLEQACADLKKYLKTPTLILPVLNGLSHLGKLQACFGKSNVLGGTAHIAATLTAEGYIKQLNPLQILTFGQLIHTQETKVLDDFAAECEKANFKAFIATNIMQSMWDKWTFLATLAGSTVLFRNSVGAITETETGAQLMLRMYKECLAVADVIGQKVSDKAEKKALGILMEPASDFTSSMLRDLIAGTLTEHNHILGELVRIGKQHKIDMPLISAAHISVCADYSKLRSSLLEKRP